MAIKLEKICFKHKHDEDPDYSHMGEYVWRPEAWVFDRATDRLLGESGEEGEGVDEESGLEIAADYSNFSRSSYGGNREYRYFKPSPGCSRKLDDFGSESDPHLLEKFRGDKTLARYGWAFADWQRVEALSRGHWHYLGIIAESTITVPLGGGHSISQRIGSGGLWGVESDSGEYIREIEQEELGDLKRILLEMGVSQEQIDECEVKEAA